MIAREERFTELLGKLLVAYQVSKQACVCTACVRDSSGVIWRQDGQDPCDLAFFFFVANVGRRAICRRPEHGEDHPPRLSLRPPWARNPPA